MSNHLSKTNIILDENKLFDVCVFNAERFSKSLPASLYYTLTLIRKKDGTSGLIFTCPEFSYPFSYETTEIKQITQVIFSEFLVDSFGKKPFITIGNKLFHSTGNLIFHHNTVYKVEKMIEGLTTNESVDSILELFQVMKILAGSECQMIKSGQKNTMNASSAAMNKINKVRNFVRENYGKSIKIKEVAGITGFSVNGFSRFFKQHTGLNFSDYINEVRIEQAIYLLRKTDDTIEGIAYSCGFNTARYFNKVFKRHQGISPGKFRNNMTRRE